MYITREKFRDVLLGMKGAIIGSMYAKTRPQYTGGKKCPILLADRYAHLSVCLNWIYANSVNRVRVNENTPLTAEGEVEVFEPIRRVWGVRVRVDRRLSPFVVKDDSKRWLSSDEIRAVPMEEMYLECKITGVLWEEYRIGRQVVPMEEVTPWLRKQKPGRQEVANPVKLRDYNLNNIWEVDIQNEIFQLV